MSDCPLCNDDGERRPSSLTHRVVRSVEWLFPATISVLVVFLPKCPMCVVAYVALFTGVSISMSTARWLQILMLVLCLSALAYLAIRCWRGTRRAV
jgi:hypothetical protein